MRIRILAVVGLVVSALIAIAATLLLITSAGDLGPKDWWGWRLVNPLAVAGAWTSCISWATDRRLLAVPGHLASVVFGPWGYLYPFPLAAILLAIAAAATFKSSAVSRITSA